MPVAAERLGQIQGCVEQEIDLVIAGILLVLFLAQSFQDRGPLGRKRPGRLHVPDPLLAAVVLDGEHRLAALVAAHDAEHGPVVGRQGDGPALRRQRRHPLRRREVEVDG